MQRRYRLQRHSDLQSLRRQGQSWRHPLAILVVLKNEEAISRFAFSASRKAGNAVARNRAKRLLREAVRSHLGEIQPGYQCLFLAREATASAAFADVEAAVVQLLKRASMLLPAGSAPAG
jgi:ribonuclease P protein component